MRTGFAKIFVDGIPPTRTAALLEPYPPAPKVPSGFKGELKHPAAELNGALARLDKLGLTVKMHATGDSGLRQDATGSIEVGKSADLIVLDRNLFEIPPDEIGDTVVLTTVLEGRLVPGAEPR